MIKLYDKGAYLLRGNGMIKLYDKGAYLLRGKEIIDENDFEKVKAKIKNPDKETAKKGTIAYKILEAHNKSGDLENLRIKFDALTKTWLGNKKFLCCLGN